ncbi:hypothetical protein D3C79_744620 [compost metagenome]
MSVQFFIISTFGNLGVIVGIRGNNTPMRENLALNVKLYAFGSFLSDLFHQIRIVGSGGRIKRILLIDLIDGGTRLQFSVQPGCF